ncbi:hypothetical protein [Dethiosulfatarculus sandiegensis]|uniref:Uncharacterized protein n=1 Tax=Dethiosulfatarculus sandiegensis TaxID=1429043 RepID=A0A0D2HR38_9BACT|nr:hypothetical protein [Dethiosulfatarculus sandiegensis]KIX12953.1 hypothetical protein X474_16810 [Dethiosulfatarculus sandiegensis]
MQREDRGILMLGILLTVLACLIFGGCTPAHMALESGFKQKADHMPVKGRQGFNFQESFSFGPYKAANVQRGWTHSTAWGFLGYEDFSAEQDYQFELINQQGKTWQVNCALGVRQKLIQTLLGDNKGSFTWEISRHGNMACTILQGDKTNSWRLVMARSTGETALNGLLFSNVKTIQVKGSNRLAGSSITLSDPTGYFFKQAGGIVGAVEVINQGAVWLLPNTENSRDPMAAASAALMLYQDIGRD